MSRPDRYCWQLRCPFAQLPTYANRVTFDLPVSLADLRGPQSGVVELSRGLYWGPELTVDLGNPSDVQRMYQAVIRIGTVDEQTELLDEEILRGVWPNLVLPPPCVKLWETRFPDLRV